MGNTQSNIININKIITTLGVPIRRNIKLAVSNDYKTIIPLIDQKNEILANITVKGGDFCDVVLNLESTTICGKKNKDTWEFKNLIPAFKVDNCYLTVYSLKQGDVNIDYSVYASPDLSRRYSDSAIQSDDILYGEITV